MLLVEYILIIEIDLLYGWAVLATEPCQQTSGCWHLTLDSPKYLADPRVEDPRSAVTPKTPRLVTGGFIDLDFRQFLEPWQGRWCEYEFFIASCTDNIYDLENERWLLGTWLIMLGFMDLGWPRVYRRSTSVLLCWARRGSLNWLPVVP